MGSTPSYIPTYPEDDTIREASHPQLRVMSSNVDPLSSMYDTTSVGGAMYNMSGADLAAHGGHLLRGEPDITYQVPTYPMHEVYHPR